SSIGASNARGTSLTVGIMESERPIAGQTEAPLFVREAGPRFTVADQVDVLRRPFGLRCDVGNADRAAVTEDGRRLSVVVARRVAGQCHAANRGARERDAD